MSMLSKALRATGLNKPGKFLGKAVSKSVPGVGLALGVKDLVFGSGSRGINTALWDPRNAVGSGMTKLFGAAGAGGPGGQCPKGFHLDKRTGTRCVRNRSMNFANGRAIGRAARRIEGAEKMFRRVLRIAGKHSSGKITVKRRGKR